MARGRIITNEITRDKRINELSDDTSRLAFTWLVTFADKEGRTNGDPALVRSMLFPRRTDVTVDQVEKFLVEWHEAGLIKWYEADGDLWIRFPKFEKNQPGLRKDREPESHIPPPSDGTLPDIVRNNDGKSQDDIPRDGGLIKEKLREEKLKELKTPAADAAEPPSNSKPKTELIAHLENLEGVFAEARASPLPDWEKKPKESQKRWRTPLKEIYNLCNKDIQKAETIVRQVTTQMRKDELTFDAPDQILKTAKSAIIDMESPNPSSVASEVY